jgi:hypothetical protein
MPTPPTSGAAESSSSSYKTLEDLRLNRCEPTPSTYYPAILPSRLGNDSNLMAK